MKKIFYFVIIPFITAGVSWGLGAIFGDYIFGPLCLFFGFLNAFYLSLGYWCNYIFGIGFSIVYSYIGFSNGLYGLTIFMLALTIPMQIYGIYNWFKNKSGQTVIMRSLNWKSGSILCVSIIAGSTLLGFLLSLIPSQNLAFLDSTSQIINIGGILVSNLRYREGWYIWIVNNVIDVVIWVLLILKGTIFSQMMVIVSVMYLVMNIVGLIYWIKEERRQKNATNVE